MSHLLRRLLQIVIGLLSFLLLLYLWVGPTFTGHLITLALLAMLSLLASRLMSLAARTPLVRVSEVILVVTLSWIALRSPRPSPAGTSPASRGAESSWLHRLANVLPEADEVYLGILTTPLFNRHTTWRGTQRLRDALMPSYREMESDPRYRYLESNGDETLLDLLVQRPQGTHAFEYVPPHPPGERMPAVIFLHGYMGNFKMYLWAMQRFADQNHMVVVLPSYGMGFWDHRGIDVIERAREHAVRDLPVDPTRIFLVGLSNGGLGVSLAGRAHPEHYAGLGYISGAIVPDVVESPAFITAWRGRPVFIIAGQDDNRISAGSTLKMVRALREQGVSVTSRIVPGEDHYLILSSLNLVIEELGRWTRAGG